MTAFDFLKWCLQSFWRWLGLLFLLVGTAAALSGLITINNVHTSGK